MPVYECWKASNLGFITEITSGHWVLFFVGERGGDYFSDSPITLLAIDWGVFFEA